MWKAFHKEPDVGLRSMFERASGEVNTRGHSWKLSVPVCRSEARRRSLAVRCVGAWNALPAGVVGVTDFGTFKSRLTVELGERLFSVL